MLITPLVAVWLAAPAKRTVAVAAADERDAASVPSASANVTALFAPTPIFVTPG
jgi:hypothetical protein